MKETVRQSLLQAKERLASAGHSFLECIQASKYGSQSEHFGLQVAHLSIEFMQNIQTHPGKVFFSECHRANTFHKKKNAWELFWKETRIFANGNSVESIHRLTVWYKSASACVSPFAITTALFSSLSATMSSIPRNSRVTVRSYSSAKCSGTFWLSKRWKIFPSTKVIPRHCDDLKWMQKHGHKISLSIKFTKKVPRWLHRVYTEPLFFFDPICWKDSYVALQLYCASYEGAKLRRSSAAATPAKRHCAPAFSLSKQYLQSHGSISRKSNNNGSIPHSQDRMC